MDVKAALVESIAMLQSAAPEGSEPWREYEELRKQVEAETDPKKLHAMAVILREAIAAARAEATDFLSWPDAAEPSNTPPKG